MRTGDELALSAMKKELARLSRAADKAKAEADEYMNVGSEFVAIHQEFAAIVKSGSHSKEALKKLDDLRARSDKATKVSDKSLVRLLDEQSNAEIERDTLMREIQNLEFRMDLRNRGASA